MAKYKQTYRCGPNRYEITEQGNGWYAVRQNGIVLDKYSSQTAAENNLYYTLRDHAVARKHAAVYTLAVACIELHELGISSANLAKFKSST